MNKICGTILYTYFGEGGMRKIFHPGGESERKIVEKHTHTVGLMDCTTDVYISLLVSVEG